MRYISLSEERKDLLRLHINHLIYTPDGIQLALFGPSVDRPKVQRDGTFGSPTIPSTELFCVWDHFPIHHFRWNEKPIIAIDIHLLSNSSPGYHFSLTFFSKSGMYVQ